MDEKKETEFTQDTGTGDHEDDDHAKNVEAEARYHGWDKIPHVSGPNGNQGGN